METFDTIRTAIEKIVPDNKGTLRIPSSVFPEPLRASLFETTLKMQELAIEEGRKEVDNKKIILRGKSAVWHYPLLEFLLSIEAGEKNKVHCRVSIAIPKGKTAALPGITWIALGNAEIFAECSEIAHAISFGYKGDLITGSNSRGIPVTIQQNQAGQWRVDFAADSQHPTTINDLVDLFGEKSVETLLPKSLSELLHEVSITGLHAILDTKNNQLLLFQAGVSVHCDWQIVPGIKIGPHLALMMSITGTEKKSLSLLVEADFVLDEIPLPLFLGMTNEQGSWAFGIQENKVIRIKKLSHLLTLGGSNSELDKIPQGIFNLPEIDIHELYVGFDPHKPSLDLIRFDVRTATPWKIIEGFFEIERIDLQMEIIHAQQTIVNCNFYSEFKLGEVFLGCRIEKTRDTPDWTITGALAEGHSLNLSKIAAQLFSGKDYIPAKVPDFSFSTLELTVVPAKKSFHFKAAADQPWKFNDHFSITKFGLQFDRDPDKQNNPITGHVNGSVEIGLAEKVNISLSAAFGETTAGGWQLEGSTDKGLIPIGHLADYVAKAFNVEAKTPEWFSGISLSEIGAGYNTKTGNFHFEVTGKIPVTGSPLTVKVKFIAENDGKDKFTRRFTGQLFVGEGTFFELDIDKTPDGTHIVGQWKATQASGYLRFEDLAHKLGFKELPSIPDSLKLTLTEASFLYDSKNSTFAIMAKSEHHGSAVFISQTLRSGKRFYGFGINVELDIRLADLPLVGDKIPGAENIGIKEGKAWILSENLEDKDVTELNKAITNAEYPHLPAGPVNARVLLHAELQLGQSNTKTLDLVLGKSKKKLSLAEQNEEAPSSPTWIDVQKQFGVFRFNRIGFAYSGGKLQFLLDAGMDLGPLTFALEGLSITTPIKPFDPHFDLAGLALAYRKGELDIEGAFHRAPKDQLDANSKFRFDGMAVIKAGKFSLAAIGSYSQMNSGDASLFLFAQLEAPIGGPPAFFITGIMAGFGFNRNLVFPEMNEVAGFPLLILGEQAHPGDKVKKQDPMHVLNVLNGIEPAVPNGNKKVWIKTESGQYWLALGLHFTSFQVVRSRALLAAQFGNDLSFALLGLSTLQLPQSADTNHPYVLAELQLRALLQPREGFFGLSAILSSSSYVLTPECHLTGGFAMYFWFGSNKYAGQFVISMGGYHPAFKKPDHYPTLPRLGFNWVVSSTVSIKGGAYFALTPSCVMAGGALEAVYRDGSIKAWFTAHADFLIAWRPFFFLASIGVSIGVDLNAGSDDTQSGMSFSVSADLDLWGPPTGGKARVHVVFITFTVRFGSDDALANNNALKWHEFSDLIPHKTEVCRIVATGGMAGEKQYGDVKKWIVRPGSFSFTTESAIPSGDVVYGSDKKSARTDEANPKLIDIRPMNKSGVSSVHHVQIFYNDQSIPSSNLKDWKFKPRGSGMPEALWGKPPASFTQVPSSPKAAMTDPLLSGLTVTSPVPQLGASPGAVPAKALALDYLSPEGCAPLANNAPVSGEYTPVADKNSISIVKTIASTDAQRARSEMRTLLKSFGVELSTNDSMQRLADECMHLYDNPVLLKK